MALNVKRYINRYLVNRFPICVRSDAFGNEETVNQVLILFKRHGLNSPS